MDFGSPGTAPLEAPAEAFGGGIGDFDLNSPRDFANIGLDQSVNANSGAQGIYTIQLVVVFVLSRSKLTILHAAYEQPRKPANNSTKYVVGAVVAIALLLVVFGGLGMFDGIGMSTNAQCLLH